MWWGKRDRANVVAQDLRKKGCGRKQGLENTTPNKLVRRLNKKSHRPGLFIFWSSGSGKSAPMTFNIVSKKLAD